MSGDALLSTWARPVRDRAMLRFGLLWLSVLLVLAVLAWRLVGGWAAVAVGIAGLASLYDFWFRMASSAIAVLPV